MNYRDTDLASLLLRLLVGGMLLFHGFHKVIHGIGGIKIMLQGAHLPEFLAYGVFVGELIAPLLLILGLYSRIGALIVIINMMMAIYLAYGDTLLALNKHGGPYIELSVFYVVVAFAIFLMGPGRYSINQR
ncbi:MAG: DoxX family protein [Campylobacterota bacterium]|nr:DoxX family protein [Campylobacterota bacterium]